ncbi:MAG TPA: nucleotidyltransferase [Verrucomicrobiae bacterium]|nr:nucleotidyltransferase [Verrucomicrobiae bacterium]
MSKLEALLQQLVEHDVEFVVIGAFASTMHGVTLTTLDVDVCCPFTPRNLLKLRDAIADLHPVHRLTPQRLPLELTREKCRGLKNLYLETDLGVLDCLGEVLGVGSYAAVKHQSVVLEMPIGKCRVLGLDALIKSKRAMDRPRDREAVKQLEAIRARKRRGRQQGGK